MASGDALLVFTPHNNDPTDADFATLDTILTTSADEPDDVVLVLDFDPGATSEFASWVGVMPEHYASGGITLDILWTSEATSGAVVWEAALKNLGDAVAMLAATYAAKNTVTTTTDGTARAVNTSQITFTDGADMDSVLKNEMFRLTIDRDGDAGGDTMNSNDAELIAVYMRET